ncbi:tryptophan synthase alpha chain [Sphingomonas vulcanisoli]|uniref:Tryptophan synthase alpha chain n=1 Tax=Sphingomonas vulcanisoli TaxID=1658060 RepID=A0ABX0TSF6_9SPHN|nr:tryptophan synthase subunit alpha [Sphingomonas vulcanisoli]NIJ07460.1 tryptophan synthase alpha chain [Sphingomonas vulcanisoli]
MSRIGLTFASTSAEGRAALICFVTGGDPSPEATPAILDALVENGADLIELGLPFTDPMADGPAIQLANLRALAAGANTAKLLDIARDFRARHPDVPLVLMGYANTMLRRGAERFAEQAAEAGADGVICVDIPAEQDGVLGPALRAQDIAFIRLATPTTDAARLPAVLEGAGGFLYYVSVAGITGQQQAQQASIEDAVVRLKAATHLPIAVGFGVRTPDQAAAIGKVADGVVVGSAIIDAIAKAAAAGEDPAAAAGQVVAGLAAALRNTEKVPA